MKYYTWDDLYERAMDTAFGDPRLRAKDEARFQTNNYAMDKGYEDAEEAEIPEEVIDDYCNKFELRFDENGNINAIGVTNIEFLNPDNGYTDETQFDTQDEKELADLWWKFCKENGFIRIGYKIADYNSGDIIE